ncbi:MAG: hypothetical protein WCI76_01025 [bacterium]
MKRAIFPDSKSLQPIPKGAEANISGNINSTTRDGAFPVTNPTQTPLHTETAPAASPDNKTDQGEFSFYLSCAIITCLILCTVFFVYKKLTNTSQD